MNNCEQPYCSIAVAFFYFTLTLPMFQIWVLWWEGFILVRFNSGLHFSLAPYCASQCFMILYNFSFSHCSAVNWAKLMMCFSRLWKSHMRCVNYACFTRSSQPFFCRNLVFRLFSWVEIFSALLLLEPFVRASSLLLWKILHYLCFRIFNSSVFICIMGFYFEIRFYGLSFGLPHHVPGTVKSFITVWLPKCVFISTILDQGLGIVWYNSLNSLSAQFSPAVWIDSTNLEMYFMCFRPIPACFLCYLT